MEKKYTKQDLIDGKICIHYEKKYHKEINELFKECFPEHYKSYCAVDIRGLSMYYYANTKDNRLWDCSNYTKPSNMISVKYDEIEEFVLPQYWSILRNKDNYEIINAWIIKHYNCDESYFYAKSGFVNNKNKYAASYDLPIITFEQFKKYVLKENKMKEDKKIIGYKAPMDLYGGLIKKDMIYVKANNHVSYYLPTWCENYSMPKEIVETWEAVYEDKLYLKNHDGTNSYEIKINTELRLANIEGHSFDLGFWKALKTVNFHDKAEVYVGCGAKSTNRNTMWKVDKETVDEIIKRLS